MNLDASILKKEERAQFRLRALYSRYGYARFKMSKFEEYDLYVRNKDFLISDSVITFTDTNGRLLALKPDVTLSIVKNTRDGAGAVQRLYYNENVYRVSEQTHTYKEILQAGLECIGDLDFYHLCEVACLAAESLQILSPDSVLNLSHLGIVSAVLAHPALAPLKDRLLPCIGQKNAHGIETVCRKAGVEETVLAKLQAIVALHGPAEEVLRALRGVCTAREEQAAVEALAALAQATEQATRLPVRLDLSLVGDMRYYNGLIFQGYVNGLPAAVLSGGQYDPLMKRMGKTGRAIGFAVYLDQLERLEPEQEYDVDTVLLYEDEPPAAVLAAARELTRQGQRVLTAAQVPETVRARQVLRVTDVSKGGASHG